MSNRQKIDGGGWFDSDTARQWDEDTYWDGSNHISQATGSQWDHETLYLTRRGTWVVKRQTAWQGRRPSGYERVDAADAAAWLIANGHDNDAEELFPDRVAQAEI